MHTFLRSCGKPLWWLALLCGAWTAAHSAEPVTEQDLKAAYIFNFIQFIEWPEKQGSGNEFTVCVSPFSPLKRSLTALENKQTTRGQTIKIRHLEAATLRECEALIVHNPDAEHVLRALRAAPQGHGVLTIADDMTFVDPDIVIALAQSEGRLVFHIHPEAATKAGLTISSRLLRLAKGTR